MGTAFLVIGDVLGNNLGDDLREGKCTLPLITAMQLVAP